MYDSESFEAAVREQNVIEARTIILYCLNSDKRRSTPQAVQIARENAGRFPNPNNALFEEEKPAYLGEVPSESLWDDKFFDRIKGALCANFSLEKLELAEKVIVVLRAKGLPDFQVEMPPKSVHHPQPSQLSQGQKKSLSSSQDAAQNTTTTNDGNAGKRPCPKPRLQPNSNAQEDFLKGMLLGGVMLGGAGLLIGLAAGCALKAAITGTIVGGVAGGCLSYKMKHK